MSSVALLLAGGAGERMHDCLPKQFVEVRGIPVVGYTMKVFESCVDIDAVYVVCRDEWVDLVVGTAERLGIEKFCGTFPAGSSGVGSVWNGVCGLRGVLGVGANPAVVVHESVRPLVSCGIISDNLRVFRSFGNAVTGVRSNEAYMVSRDGVCSEGYIAREELFRAQTPITFCLNDLEVLFGSVSDFGGSVPQSLFVLASEVWRDRRLYVSPGSELNFKLTLPGDMDVLRAIVESGGGGLFG